MNRMVLCSVLVLGCGSRVERQTHSVDTLQVSWSDGDGEQEEALADLFQSGEEQLVVEFDVDSAGDGQTITLWQGTASAGGATTMDDALGSSTEGWTGGLGSEGSFRYSVYLSIDSIELGGITLLTPNGVWLSGERDESGITGDMRFDEPEEWGGPGSLLADVLVDVLIDVLFASWDDSATIAADEPVDISGISFRIDYQLELIESE